MANFERINKAIAVMERVRDRGDNLDMRVWQERRPLRRVHRLEQKLHKCGTAACFAGWLAVSSEFQEDGGSMSNRGLPIFKGGIGPDAIAYYLEISYIEAVEICAMDSFVVSEYYKVNSYSEITAQMVIDKLQELIDTG